MTVAGHIAPKPETVREAVIAALGDFARAYNRPAEAASVDLYERVVRDFLPEAVAIGAQKALEDERFFPAPATLRKYVHEEHARLVSSRNAVVPQRGESTDGMVCWTCGARAHERNNRLVIDHDQKAHGIYMRSVTL